MTTTTRIRHYMLRCGAEYRNTEILPVGTLVTCRTHLTPRGMPVHIVPVVRKLRAMTELEGKTP